MAIMVSYVAQLNPGAKWLN